MNTVDTLMLLEDTMPPALKRLHSQTLLVYTVEEVPLKYSANS